MGLLQRFQLSQDYDQRKRQLIVITVLVVGFILLVAVLIYMSTKSENRDPITAKRVPIPALGENGAATSEELVTFFNGRNFIDYNLTNNTTQQVLSDRTFPSVIKVSWSPNGQFASFYSSQQTVRDTLGEILVKQGKSLDGTYWWVFNKQNKSFDLLAEGKSIRDISWSNDNELFALGFNDSNEGDRKRKPNTPVTTYNFSDKQFKPFATISSDVVDRLFPTKQGLYYTAMASERFELKQWSSDSSTRVVAKTNSDKVGVSSDGSFAYYFTINDGGGDEPQGADIQDDSVVPIGSLSVIKASDSSEILKLENVSSDSKFAFGADNAFWTLTPTPEGKQNLTKYTLPNKKPVSLFVVDQGDTSISDVLDLVAAGDTVFIKSLRGYEVVGNNKVVGSDMPLLLDIPKASSSYTPFVTTQSSRTFMIIVNIFAPPLDKNKAAALKQLTDLGANTDLFKIEYDTTNLDDPT